MKHLYNVLFAGILLAGCAKEEVLPQMGDDDNVAFSSVICADTKVSYSPESDAVRLSWTKGDAIGIYSACAQVPYASNIMYVAEQSDAVSTFMFASPVRKIKWKNNTEPHDFYAYYPYGEKVGDDPSVISVSVPAVQTQSGADNTTHISDSHFMWASRTGVIRSEEPVTFDFKHIFSVIDLELLTTDKMVVDKVIFRIKDNEDAALAFAGGAFDLADGSLDLKDAQTSSSVTVNCGFTSSPGSSKHVYALVNPGHAGQVMQICLVIKGKEKVIWEKTVPSEGLIAGQYLCASASYAPSADETVEITDLSAMETSNCYLIAKPGTAYKFKATVKGNGHIPSELSSTVTSADLNPGSVLVLWYNTRQTGSDWLDVCPIDMASLSLANGYVHFDTPQEFHDGNLVVAAFAEEGLTYDSITIDEAGCINNATLLWSWNIWAVEDLDLDAEAIKVTYTAEDQTQTEFTVMDRNLGALVNGKDLTSSDPNGFGAAAALGNTYQWGRKDPVPHVADYGNYWPLLYSTKLLMTPTYTPIKALQRTADQATGSPEKQLWVMNYDKMGGGGAPAIDACLHQFDKASESFADAVNAAAKYPYKNFKGANSQTYDKHWFPNNPQTDPWKYLWGDKDPDDGAAISKTLFDPCPAGWTLWQEETVKAFVQQGAETASVAPNKRGLMVAGSYFGYNGGGRQQDMAFAYSTPFVPCAYACPIGMISGTASDRYNNKILRNFLWQSPKEEKYDAEQKIIINNDSNDAGVAQGYTVRCIKTNN
jgi:hypothetical protein